MALIYKILSRSEWQAAQQAGQVAGSAVDLADGYIHFSTAAQAGETARKHFSGQADLLVLTLEADNLGEHLKWEPSRGGELFPHLYGPLHIGALGQHATVSVDADGSVSLPEWVR